MEASKNYEIEQVIITSTSETYGSAKYVPIDENHPLVGQSPYSATKIGADQLAISYFKSFETPVKIIRPFNVYGPRQSSRAIIPTIIAQIINDFKTVKLGNINTKRDFTYVTDICLAYLEIFKSSKLIGEIVNVGTKRQISIYELFTEIKSKLNSSIDLEQVDYRKRNQNSEVTNLLCDNSKLINLTSWKQEYDFSKGLDLTIDWVRKNIDTLKPDIYHV